ncbi:hypothetical protein HMI54_010714 [Coelomomyces lativittatus]|nr:hypothetical protein HMI54_010714 [Coelomomyces lativittatus]KAJ1500607.1 hypothetical protein HMI56_003726 [Coelomomyces lativittatus]
MKFQTKQKVFQTLKSSLTTTDIQLRINQLEVENEKFTTRLSKLNEGTEIVDPVARQLLESTLKSYKSAWSSKKRRVKDAVDLITEQLDKKPTEFMEDIGIETDEMIGLDITQVFDIKRAIFND